MTVARRRLPLTVSAVVAIVFGALTVVSGGRALFGGVDMGNVVGFVLWFNFCAGFAYVLAGAGLWRSAVWGRTLAVLIFVATLLVLLAFGVHVLRDGVFEMRTVYAMLLRTSVWAVIAAVALRYVRS